MIYLKRPEQIEKISEAGKISLQIMLNAISSVKAGVTGLQIDSIVSEELKKHNCEAWFKEVEKYPFSSCVSVNENWIHGIPNDMKFEVGDIVSIDIGVKKDGYYVDHCWTVPVFENEVVYKKLPEEFSLEDKNTEKFLNTGVRSLMESISSIKIGSRTGIISNTMERVVKSEGYDVVKEYAGHGVGISSHEDPLIACYGAVNQGPALKQGMVLAVEVMYSMGNSRITTAKDGWTVATADGSLTGMFEHTVAVTKDGPVILTN